MRWWGMIAYIAPVQRIIFDLPFYTALFSLHFDGGPNAHDLGTYHCRRMSLPHRLALSPLTRSRASAAMETILAAYWKTSSRAAITEAMRVP